MKIVVVHEDGDRASRVQELAGEVRHCVKNGTMRYQGVRVEVRHSGAVEPPAKPELPEFVTVTSRTGTSSRWWCDDCDWGGGWVSPREAFDGAYEHVNARHPKTT